MLNDRSRTAWTAGRPRTLKVRLSLDTSISAISRPRRAVLANTGPPGQRSQPDQERSDDRREPQRPDRVARGVLAAQDVEAGVPVHERDGHHEGQGLDDLAREDRERV